MQQNLQISHATAEREYEFCKKLQQQLISHSTHVYFSHAECRDDIELNASPLIKNIPELTHDELDLSLFYLPNFEIFQSRSYQFINDEIAPNVTIGEQIPGGIQIIKNQAMCPFKAFATHRLLTKSPEKTSIGIKKSDKGKLIHLILELFWKEIVNQDQLLKMSTVECEKLLETHIQTAFKSLNLDHQDQKKLLTLESFRIKTILLEWLNIEKQREPFKVVDLEIKNNIQISKISIETRIDRIDQLSDLSFLVIDYKSGKYNDISNWFGDRPDDPQLPCYATFTNHAIHGLAYAQVTSNQSGFKGIHQQPVRVKGIKTINEVKHTNAVSWLEQQNLWRTHIEKISDEFIAGYAHVDPKNKNVTCDQCHLHPLCRIKEKLNEYE
jgi:probable DNA repair protein